MRLAELLAEIIDRVPMSPADRERLHRELTLIGWRLDPAPPRPFEVVPLWGDQAPEHLPPQED